MVKFSLEERNGAAVEGESSSGGKSSKRVRYFSDDEEDVVADDCTDDEPAPGINEEKQVVNANVPLSADAIDSSISVILTDPEVLDCTICYDSLTIPVFQCENGHIACSSCCTKLKHKCASCSFPIGYNRCRAIEKVIESVRVLCHNSVYGCTERLCLNGRRVHEDKCSYSPFTCPIDRCSFLGSCQQLLRHCSDRHSVSVKRFQYHRPLPFVLDKNCKIILLQEEGEGALFILINSSEIYGNSVKVKFVGPILSDRVLSYDLMAKQGVNTLSHHSVMENHSSIFGISSYFLPVPHTYFDSHRQLKMELCIQPTNSG